MMPRPIDFARYIAAGAIVFAWQVLMGPKSRDETMRYIDDFMGL